ncbi:MAG: ATP-binding cassette domain-containing protein [Chlorobiales bacterium]|nr:ATP-binding cassette domain-containing protein [Chlorobiales bacterium]
MISVSQLRKEFRIFKKAPGLLGSFKSLFNRKYEIQVAVSDISFDIQRGELVGFLGPNGAGKTTTLKMLSGLLYPTSGEVSVLGYKPYERDNEFRKQFSLVLGQKNQLWWDLPAYDSFLLLKEIYEISDAAFDLEINRLSSLLNVEDKLEIQVRRLSLGERMKMELIGSLLHAPKVLFLDEPTIGLDVVAQKTIRDFIKAYNQESQTTILLTSHYMQDIEALCKRVIIIDKGKLFFDGQLDDVLDRFSSEKILSLEFQHPIEKAELEQFGTVEEFSSLNARMRIPRSSISNISSNILKALPVHDLNIEEIPIEEIIRKIFSTSK